MASIVGGVIAFATFKGRNNETTLPTITIWGTFPSDTFGQYLSEINSVRPQSLNINYVELSQTSFSQDFISALARGTAPDAILIPSDIILPHLDKIYQIPFTSYPQRTFIDTHINQAGLYLGKDGIYAFPFTVDPLVMYWNREMFDIAGIATYPRFWNEFSSLGTKLTVKDQNGNVRKSVVALGQFNNIDNAREIFGTLLLQSRNPVTAYSQYGLGTTINNMNSTNITPVIEFFTKFSNPAHADYSWNRSLPSSKASFLAGTLATYFGFASELNDIRIKNPNLKYDVAPIPQIGGQGLKATYGKMYGFSIVKQSRNITATYQIISILTSPQFLKLYSEKFMAPSVRRDVIASGSKNPYITISNEAALVSNSWLDVDPVQSKNLFANMIEQIVSGRSNINQAITDTGDQYDIILRRAQN